MKRMVWLVAVLLIFTGLISEMAETADDPVDQLAQFIFSPNELGEGWKLKLIKPAEEELSLTVTVIFEHKSGSTFYQFLRKFENKEGASSFFAQKLEEAGEDVRKEKDLADNAYIKPSIQEKPRELVFIKDSIVTIYWWNREGAEDLARSLFDLARSQLGKMGEESK